MGIDKQYRKIETSLIMFKAGFTLIEVMATTAVLSLGIVAVYEAFFIAADSYNYCANYLDISTWMEEKLWQVSHSLSDSGGLAGIATEGVLKNRGKDFHWEVSQEMIYQPPDLYHISLKVDWQEGKRKVNLRRDAYALHYKEE